MPKKSIPVSSSHRARQHRRQVDVADLSASPDARDMVERAQPREPEKPSEATRRMNPDGTVGGWVGPDAHVGDDVIIDGTSVVMSGRVEGNVLISSGSYIEKSTIVTEDNERAVIENSSLERSRVSGNVHVLDSSQVEDSTLEGHVTVANSYVRQRATVADGAHVESSVIKNRSQILGNVTVVRSTVDGSRVMGSSYVADSTVRNKSALTGKPRVYDANVDGGQLSDRCVVRGEPGNPANVYGTVAGEGVVHGPTTVTETGVVHGDSIAEGGVVVREAMSSGRLSTQPLEQT